MPRRQPQSTRVTWVATTIFVLTEALSATNAAAAESGLMQLLAEAAAPALQAAAPSNDPMVAGRELLNRSLASGFAEAQRAAPPWLQGMRFQLSFDAAFQPRYALSITEPLWASSYHDSTLALEGRLVHDAAGGSGGDGGLRYHGEWYDQDVTLAVQGGIEDRWLQEFQRYRLGAELLMQSLEVRANLYDEVPAQPATREIAERRLDGYDLEIGAQMPFVPWVWLRASRFWQVALNGTTVDTRDRISLRLTPLAPLEIETGTRSHTAAERSRFAHLRWRLRLDG